MTYSVGGTIKKSSYTGNNTVNRGIPHGLKITPKYIIFQYDDKYYYECILSSGVVTHMDTTNYGFHAVSAADSTNFYIGNATNYAQSCNNSGIVYTWVAFA